MAKIKKKPKLKKNFTVISNIFIRDDGLSYQAKGMLSTLYSLPAGWDINREWLSSLSTDGVNAVRAMLRELEAAHYLKREAVKRKDGRIGEFDYTIIEDPKSDGLYSQENLPLDENPPVENPPVESPPAAISPVVEPPVENCAQLNTINTNTIEIKDYLSNIFSPEAERFGKWRAPWREKKEKFTPPGVEEVRDFCLDRGISVDAEHFVNYYTANGWHIGRSRMKDWRSAVICWEKNGGAKAEPKRSDGGRYEKRKEGHMSSFDAKDFFEAALRKSYAGCKAES